MKETQSFKSIIIILFLVLATLFFIKTFDLSYPLSIVTTTRSSELSVVGEGKIDAVPDIAYVDAGITVSSGETVEEVQKSINQTNNDVLQAVNKLGIPKQDISTSNYSINPGYSFENGQDRVNGYTGNVTITIKVKDTQRVPALLEALTKAGANQIQGVRFAIDNPDNLREQARNKAIQNAKDQAQRLAKTLGIRLGRVVNIIESSSSNNPIPYMQKLAVDGIGGAPEVEPGTQTVTSTVTLFFEKK